MLGRWQFWTVVVTAAAAVLLYRASPPGEGPKTAPAKRVAFVTGGSGDYWESAVAGAEAAAKDLGIKLEVRMPKQSESIQQQVELLSAVSSADVDAVAVSPLDAEGEIAVLNHIASSKPVVTFDSDAPNSARQAYVGASNFGAGLVAGTLVKRAIPEGGKIAVLLANETKYNLVERREGFQIRIAESPNPEESPIDPRDTILGYFTDDGDSDACRQIIRDQLSAHPDLACFVAFNAQQGPVLIETLKELGRGDEIKLVTFDTLEETLRGVEDGRVFATVAQDPFKYGYEAITMIDYLCRGDQRYLPVVGRGATHISVEPLMKDDVAAYRERVQSRSASAASKPKTASL